MGPKWRLVVDVLLLYTVWAHGFDYGQPVCYRNRDATTKALGAVRMNTEMNELMNQKQIQLPSLVLSSSCVCRSPDTTYRVAPLSNGKYFQSKANSWQCDLSKLPELRTAPVGHNITCPDGTTAIAATAVRFQTCYLDGYGTQLQFLHHADLIMQERKPCGFDATVTLHVSEPCWEVDVVQTATEVVRIRARATTTLSSEIAVDNCSLCSRDINVEFQTYNCWTYNALNYSDAKYLRGNLLRSSTQRSALTYLHDVCYMPFTSFNASAPLNNVVIPARLIFRASTLVSRLPYTFPGGWLKVLDLDADGNVTSAEAQSYWTGFEGDWSLPTYVLFADLDTDSSGGITPEEVAVAINNTLIDVEEVASTNNFTVWKNVWSFFFDADREEVDHVIRPSELHAFLELKYGDGAVAHKVFRASHWASFLNETGVWREKYTCRCIRQRVQTSQLAPEKREDITPNKQFNAAQFGAVNFEGSPSPRLRAGLWLPFALLALFLVVDRVVLACP